MQQIINFIKDSFQTKEFSSSDRQALKKLISVKQPSAHELNVLRSELFGLIENQSNSADVVKLVNWIEGINKCLLPKQEDVKTPENR